MGSIRRIPETSVNNTLALLIFGKEIGIIPEIIDWEQDVIRSYERFIALAPAQYKEQIEYACQKLGELKAK